MPIYIEYVLLDNLIIDYYILKCTLFLAKIKFKRLKVILSSVVGTIVAVCYPMLITNQKIIFAIKGLLALIMVLIAGDFKGLKDFFYSFNVFILLTFLSGGAIIAVLYSCNLEYVISGTDVIYNQGLPVSIMLLTSCVLSSIIIKIAKRIYKNREFFPFVRKCEILLKGKSFSLTGFIDSGNRLFDKKSGFPIVVIGKQSAYKLDLFSHLSAPCGKVPFNTVGGGGYMLLYSISGIVVHSIDKIDYKNCLLAISEQSFSDYDLILHPAIINV